MDHASTGSIFSVSSTTGEVTLLGALDRETTRTHVITIQVSYARLLITAGYKDPAKGEQKIRFSDHVNCPHIIVFLKHKCRCFSAHNDIVENLQNKGLGGSYMYPFPCIVAPIHCYYNIIC